MRILIVEDDSLFAEILQTFVEDKKCKSIIADTIKTAKDLLRASTFDFVLLDNHLPDGDGINNIDVFKDLSESPLPIMMITGDDNQNVMAEAFAKGVDDFIIKPLSLDLLWSKMERVHTLYEKEAKLEEQAKSLELLLNNQAREEELARYVYEHISSSLIVETKHVETYLNSSSVFNGDVFICDSAPNGNRFVILADATGHGLSAAICILPLVGTMKAMIRKGLSLAHIIHETNKKLGKELPDDKFVALIGIEINFHTKNLSIFSGGMPDIIAVSRDRTIERLPSTSMALGIMDPEDFDPAIKELDAHPYINLLFFSDGLIEQQNILGEEFGMDRAIEVVNNYDFDSSEGLLSNMINHFTVFNELNDLQDDLSLCDLQIDQLLESHQESNQDDSSKRTGKLFASVVIEGGLLAETDLIGIFDSLMRCADVVGDLRQKAFTVFAELISNALDHGILDLDSGLKNDIEGFAEYIALKEERLGSLKDENKLDMSMTFCPRTETLSFSIVDSGSGYDFTVSSEMKDSALSGRGMPLINKLCKQVDVQAPGNNTSVTLIRDI